MNLSFLRNRLLLIIFIFLPSTAAAQFNYGLRAGGQLVTVRHNDPRDLVPDPKWRPAYHGGLFFTYQFSRKFSAVADLLYSDKGYRLKGDDRNYNIHLEYLSVPVMIQYHLNDRFSLLGGAEFELLLDNYYNRNGYKQYPPSYTRPISYSLVAGAAYQLNPRINMMARYYGGISNLSENKGYSVNNFEIKSRSVQLSLGYFYQREEDKTYRAEHWKSFSIDFRQGLSRYVLTNNGRVPSSGRNGYHAEIDFRFYRRNFYTSIGVAYMQKGGVYPGEYDEEIRQNFLAIPLIIGYSPLRTKYVTFSLEGGIAYNHLLSSENLEIWEFGTAKDDIASALYGIELATDVLPKITPFVSYRKEIDLTHFADLKFVGEASHMGQVLSVGVRLKRRSFSKETYHEHVIAREQKRAQIDSIAPRFVFGMKLGVNLNNTTHDEPVAGQEDHSKSLLGGHGGIYFQFRLHRRLSLAPELLLITKGFRFNHDGTERKATARYLELPLLFSYQLTKKIAIDAGVSFAYLTNKKIDPEFPFIWQDERYDWYFKEAGLEHGVVVGGRYNVHERVAFGLRYYRGLSDISNQNWNDADEFNTNFQLFTAFCIR